MFIKIFAFLSLFPSLYSLNKIVKRKDLTCIDIIIFFQTIYMAIIPLFGDIKYFPYKSVQSDLSLQIYVFFIYNVFTWLLVVVDYFDLFKQYSIIKITVFVRKWAKKKN